MAQKQVIFIAYNNYIDATTLNPFIFKGFFI